METFWCFVGVIITYLVCHSATEVFEHDRLNDLAVPDELLTSKEQETTKVYSEQAKKNSTEDRIETDGSWERTRRETAESLSSNMERFFSEDEHGRFRLSPKVCVFSAQLLSSIDTLLFLVPSDPLDRWIHLVTAMDNAWAHRNRQLKHIVKRLMMNPIEDEFAENFWQAFNDLDVDVEPQLATNELKRILAQLGKVNTLEYATPQWQQDLAFWENASRQVQSVGVEKFELSPPDERAIRELTMPSARQKESWREMLNYRFFTPDQRTIAEVNERQQVQAAQYRSCLWVMRCELHDLRVYKLMNYLHSTWRGARSLLTEDTKMSQVIDIFCTAVSEIYWLGLDYCPRGSGPEGAGMTLTRDDYADFLKVIEVEYYPSTVHRDTVRILLKFFHSNGGAPLPL